MPITIVDLDSREVFEDAFATPQEAHDAAKRSGWVNYELWEGRQFLDRVGEKPRRSMIDRGSDTDLEF